MFDFEALAQMKESIDKKEEKATGKPKKKKTVAKPVEAIKEAITLASEVIEIGEEVVKQKSKEISMDEKLEIWIEERKGEPKVVFSDVRITCIYEEEIETVTMINKVTGEEVSFVSKEFFERAVFDIKTRVEKEEIVLEKYKELTGIRFTTNDSWSSESTDIEVIAEEPVEEIEDTEDIDRESDEAMDRFLEMVKDATDEPREEVAPTFESPDDIFDI